MFDEENKTKTYKKVKSHKKVILDILWKRKKNIENSLCLIINIINQYSIFT